MELIAVYGTLKHGFPNHEFLAMADHVANMRTMPQYTMVDLGPYPGVILNGKDSIYVELYSMSSERDLKNIDKLEGFPFFYQKTQIDTDYGKATMYHLPESYLKYPKILSGFWDKNKDSNT